MNKTEITELHNSNLNILKKQIEIRKQQLLIEHSDKIVGFILQWVGDNAYIGGEIHYKGQTVKFRGNIFLTIVTINVVIENDLPPFLFAMFGSFAEDKIRQEIKTILQIKIPPGN